LKRPEKIKQSEDMCRRLIENAPAGIYEIYLTNVQFIISNDLICEYTDYSEEELLNLNFTDLLTQECMEKLLER